MGESHSKTFELSYYLVEDFAQDPNVAIVYSELGEE